MMSNGEKRYMKDYRRACRGWLPLGGLIKRRKDCCCLRMIRNGQRGLRRRNRIWKRPIMCKSTLWYKTICCGRWRPECGATMAKFCESHASNEFARAKKIPGLKLSWTKGKIGRFEGCWRHPESEFCVWSVWQSEIWS